MPASYTEDGIVLRRIDYGETDRILTVLTRGRGKVGVIARGVRKPRSKLAAHTDLFMRSTMQLAPGRGELEVLAQASAALPVSSSSDPIRLTCASACTELVDRVVETGAVDVDVFDLLATALTECMGEKRDPRSVMIWFAQRMINRLGYAPQLDRCASCEQRLPEAPATFVPRTGGLVCSSCYSAATESVTCSVRSIKVLRTLAKSDDQTFWRLRLDQEVLRELESVVEAELAEHLGRQLRAMQMLRTLLPARPR